MMLAKRESPKTEKLNPVTLLCAIRLRCTKASFSHNPKCSAGIQSSEFCEMTMFNDRRVEEELERIRKANLPSDKNEVEEANEREIIKTDQTDDIKITAKDVLAMIIAALSLILPYVVFMLIAAALILYIFVGF